MRWRVDGGVDENPYQSPSSAPKPRGASILLRLRIVLAAGAILGLYALWKSILAENWVVVFAALFVSQGFLGLLWASFPKRK
jgi:hypothetical protein